MKIQMNVPLLDLEDQVLEIPGPRLTDGKGAYVNELDGRPIYLQVPMTLGRVLARALVTDQQGVQLNAEEKETRLDLARMIRESLKSDGLCDLTSEEIVKIKAQVNLNFTTLVVGQVNKLLENKDGTN